MLVCVHVNFRVLDRNFRDYSSNQTHVLIGRDLIQNNQIFHIGDKAEMEFRNHIYGHSPPHLLHGIPLSLFTRQIPDGKTPLFLLSLWNSRRLASIHWHKRNQWYQCSSFSPLLHYDSQRWLLGKNIWQWGLILKCQAT